MEPIKPDQTLDLSKSVLKRPLQRDELRQRMITVLDEAIPLTVRDASRMKSVQYNDKAKAVEKFMDYAATQGLKEVMPDEALVFGFIDALVAGGKPRPYAIKLSQHVRTLINGFSEDVFQRPLATTKQWTKLHRLDSLTPETRRFMEWFLRDGRRTRGGSLSPHVLAARFRDYIVTVTLNFLACVGKTDILSVTAEDAEKFISDYELRGNQRSSAINILADIRLVFQNLVGKKMLGQNPLQDYHNKASTIDNDYVTAEGMAVLTNLSTVDWDDFTDVRDRMLVVVFFYDFALRLGETVRLKTTDLEVGDDSVGLTVRPEIQKGMNKLECYLGNYVPESSKLVQAYIKMRDKIAPDTDALIIRPNGKPMLESGCRTLVQQHCEKLGVKTFKGNTPSPHRFRHSLASLNIDPLGFRLSIYDVMQRLRHEDLATSSKIYITNNRELQKLRHEERVNIIRGSRLAPVGGVPRPATSSSSMISEVDAVRLVSHLGIHADALKKYGLKNKVAMQVGENLAYSAHFISDLSKNWITKQKAMDTKRYSSGGFFYWAKTNRIRPLRIGRASLYQRADVLAEHQLKSA